MKLCTCGGSKWKTNFASPYPYHQCLKCYKKYGFGDMRKLKNKKEKK